MTRIISSQSLNGSGPSAAFTTIQTDAGTYPVATGVADTLTLTSSDSTVTITGDSTTDTVNFQARIATGATVFGGTTNAVLFVGPSLTIQTDPLIRFYADRDFLMLGSTLPLARLHLAGALSSTAWTTAGIGIRSDAATYTDITSSGTVTSTAFHGFAQPTLTSSSPAVYTLASTVYIANSPTVSGSSTFISTPFSLWVDAGDSRFDGKISTGGFGGGTGAPTHNFGGNISLAAGSWGANGAGIRFNTANYTDTTTTDSSTVATANIHSILTPTILATNIGASGIIYTTAANLYISAPPTPSVAGGTIIITNPFSFWIDSGNTRLDGFLQVSGSVSPTAQVDVGGAALSGMTFAATGVGIKHRGNQFTDNASSGTITNGNVNSFGTSTLNSSNPLTITHSSNIYVSAATAAGNSVTITNGYGIWQDGGDTRLDGSVAIGDQVNAVPGTVLQVNGRKTAAAWNLTGIRQRNNANIYTDSSSSGTGVTAIVIDAFLQPTLAASSGCTFNQAYSFYVAGNVAAGSNVNIQDSWTAWFNSGYVRMSTGAAIGGGQTLPLATCDVSGSLAGKVRSVATSASLLVSDQLLCITNTSAARTVLTPPASSCFSANSTGHVFYVKDTGGTAAINNITIQAGTSTLIDGTTFAVINTAFGVRGLWANSVSSFAVI